MSRGCRIHGLPLCDQCHRERQRARKAARLAPLDERCAELKARMEIERRRIVAIRLLAGRGYTANQIAERIGAHYDFVRRRLREAEGARHE